MSGVLPADRWLTGADVEPYRFDRSGWVPEGRPAAVALAESVEDVSAVLREASRTGTPVVPRGAGTGLAGGAAGTDGSIVLDVSRMNRILELAPDDELAVVEPGVITADLDKAAAAYGLRYAPDPASAAISTIGGNIATNAGGLRCAKYGVTRESVLGLDVVLADGTLLRTGRRTVKGVAGYDLTGLLVGSEGTLGVVVGATLRLRPIPDETATIAARFADFTSAARASAALTAARIRPSLAELLDEATLAAVSRLDPALGSGDGALLLVQTDGPAASLEADRIESILAPLARTTDRAGDAQEAEALLAARRLALPAIERLGRPFIEDIAVPRTRLGEAASSIARIAAATGVHVCTIAHAADGNLHPIIVTPDGADHNAEKAVWETAEQIFALALDLGGTVTGEHGIGTLKRRWLTRELGPASQSLHHRLKAVFDPQNLLNPGKAL
ncbi:FAD-binding protein [Actinocorallia sp. API 0066]|uniref:FAD-binding oxidoreductase n=1 Tax=Actinocorallia sp. API 0066 TaxID=2896846 RepID=UPI001E4596BC|nr:FAD-linked oxidase C-terminal domain-containing protein [Actinocorallia sp. API 0066]MCD0449255.1 FAD-binding protein [Actinocorallia sp. API 0066]